ncbi:MAG TPA: hypothetical protein VF170_15620, partial [Planctomycetaceae bacterium]
FGGIAGGLRPPRTASGAAGGPKGLLWRSDEAWRRAVAHGDARERFLWVWLAVAFAIVTVSANKHPHYILPALPAFSLWTGRRFAQLAEQAREGRRLLTWPLATGLTAVSLGTAAGLAAFDGRLPDGLTAATLLPVVGTAAAGLTAAGWLLYFRRNKSAAVTAAAAWVIAYGAATLWLVPGQDHRAGAYRFAEEVRARYGHAVEVGLYGMDQDAAVWYLGEPVFRAESPEQIAARLEASPRLRLLTTAGHMPTLAEFGELRVVERFRDRPGLPRVELGHYRQMVLVELTARSGLAAERRVRR